MAGITPRTVEKRDEFVSGALGAEGEGNGGEAVDGVKPKQNIVVLDASRRDGGQN